MLQTYRIVLFVGRGPIRQERFPTLSMGSWGPILLVGMFAWVTAARQNV